MRSALFASFITLIFSLSSSAQIVEKTEEKAKRKSEKRLDQKIDNGIDNGLNAIEGLFSKKKKKKNNDKETVAEDDNTANDAGSAAMMKIFGSSNVDVKESYNFDHRFIIFMEEIDKKGKKGEAYEMAYLTKEGSSVMGMEMNQEGTQTEIIYDLESLEMISLINTEGQKIGTVMKLDPNDMETMMGESDDTDASQTMPQFEKTGNSKVISGYNCDEYVVTNVEEMEGMEGTVTYWITEEAEIDWISTMSGMTGYNEDMPSIYAGTGYPENGTLIQMIMEEEDGSGSIMTVKEIQKDQKVVINTSGYTFMNMPGGR